MLISNPNLTIDRTMEVPGLVSGAVLRAARTVVTLGGKGVNVGRVQIALGAPARVIGLVAQESKPELDRLAAREDFEFLPVPRTGVARTTVVMLEDITAGVPRNVTVINESGDPLEPGEWERYEDAIRANLRPGELLVCMGSLPTGAPVDGYGRLVEIARQLGSKCFVDAAPAALRAALAHRPYLVAPNLEEAEAMLAGQSGDSLHFAGDEADVPARAQEAAQRFHDLGAEVAVVTAGSAGAAVAVAENCWWSPAVKLERVVSAVGAGDSFMGGLCYQFCQNAGEPDWPANLHFAGVVAAASCEVVKAGGVEASRVQELLAVEHR